MSKVMIKGTPILRKAIPAKIDIAKNNSVIVMIPSWKWLVAFGVNWSSRPVNAGLFYSYSSIARGAVPYWVTPIFKRAIYLGAREKWGKFGDRA